MKITINYFKKGKKQTRDIDILFVPNKVVKTYNEIMKDVAEIYQNQIKLQSIIEESNKLIEDKPEGWEISIKKHTEEIKEIGDKIRTFESNGFFEKRYELIKLLFIKNGIEENDQLCDYKFWDEDVDPNELYRILTEVVKHEFKDEKPQKKNT